jgi:hypothetical protein
MAETESRGGGLGEKELLILVLAGIAVLMFLTGFVLVLS